MNRLNGKNLCSLLISLMLVSMLLTGCKEKEIIRSVEIFKINHSKIRSVGIVTVNGRWAGGVMPDAGSGGVCCYEIPQQWHKGMKAKIGLIYSGGSILPPPPPPIEVEVEIPEYTEADIGTLEIHIFDDNQVILRIGNIPMNNPNYPKELRLESRMQP